jgi:hypothetical protein
VIRQNLLRVEIEFQVEMLVATKKTHLMLEYQQGQQEQQE